MNRYVWQSELLDATTITEAEIDTFRSTQLCGQLPDQEIAQMAVDDWRLPVTEMPVDTHPSVEH